MQLHTKVINIFGKKPTPEANLIIEKQIDTYLNNFLKKASEQLRQDNKDGLVCIDIHALENMERISFIKEKLVSLASKGLPLDLLLKRAFSLIDITPIHTNVDNEWDAALCLNYNKAERLLKNWFIYFKLKREFGISANP